MDSNKYIYFLENLIRNLGKAINYVKIINNSEIVIGIKEEYLSIVVFFFKYNQNILLKNIIDITAIDYLGKRKLKRFCVVYNFLSLFFNIRIRIKVDILENKFINSITNIYKGSNWLEREVYDMFGILFKNHIDLRRILTDYGFNGYPLRKDFPLTGYIELRYDEECKRIVYESVEVSQELRVYNSKLNPWNFLFAINKNKLSN